MGPWFLAHLGALSKSWERRKSLGWKKVRFTIRKTHAVSAINCAHCHKTVIFLDLRGATR